MDFLDINGNDFCVALRGLQAAVAQQFLHIPNVRPVLDKVRGAASAEGMRRCPLLDARLLRKNVHIGSHVAPRNGQA
jgi:hypothetical protein